MKIAFLVGQFPALGETFILDQITGLLDRGVEVDIYARTSRPQAALHPAVVGYSLMDRTHYARELTSSRHRRRVQGLLLLGKALAHSRGRAVRARRVLTHGRKDVFTGLSFSPVAGNGTNGYDVLHCHFGPVGIWGIALRNLGLLSDTVITTFHGYDLSRFLVEEGDRVYDRLFEEGDLFLPISDFWRRKLIDLGCDPGKITVHHMGVDCNKFQFVSRPLPHDGTIRLVSVARLIEKKGLEYGIRAVAAFTASRPNVEYNIIGQGPLKKHLQQLIAELGAGDRIKLVGAMSQPELIEHLQRSHVLLAPSVTSRDGNQEGIPVALMEALAIGIPVISTYHSGIPELVEHGVTGLLAPERDVRALAEALRCLTEDPQLYTRIAVAGRRRVEEEYNVDSLNDRLVDIFRASIPVAR